MSALRFGVIVDIQAALSLALGGGGGKAGVPDFSRIDPVAVVRAAHATHGLRIIELPADANYVIPGIFERPGTIAGLHAAREELGLEYTIHLPFFNVHLCSFNHHVRQASIETQVETITACEQVGGINNYVLHLTAELEDSIGAFDIPSTFKELAWGMFLDKGMASLEEIIARTGVDPRKICVENNEGIPFSKMYDILLDELDVSICLDVGHAVLQGDETPRDIVDRWGTRVHEIHLHNVIQSTVQNRIRVRDDHKGLARGVIDIPAFLGHLEVTGFAHPVLLEITSQDEIVQSIAYLRDRGFLPGPGIRPG